MTTGTSVFQRRPNAYDRMQAACVPSMTPALDDVIAPLYKSSVRPHADISTPLRNIQLLTSLRVCIFRLQRRLSDGDSDTFDHPHPGQRLAHRMDVGRVAFNLPTRSHLLRLQTSSRSSVTNVSMCMISDVHRFHDAIACFYHIARCNTNGAKVSITVLYN